MTITDAISAVYLRATGKATTPPTSKMNQIIGLLDFYQRRWAREKDVDWNSLYTPVFSIGTVTNTDSFSIDTDVRKLSDREGDYVQIVWTDKVGYTNYDIVDHDALKDYYYGVSKQNPTGFYCAQIGAQLVFNHTFVSTDPQFGGTIFAPVYGFTNEITSDSLDDDIQVDDPDWLVTRVAAEFVRNDIVRRSRYPELLAEANEMMKRMIDDNDGQVAGVLHPWTPFTGSNNRTGIWN